MIKRLLLIGVAALPCLPAVAAINPVASKYDSHMQNVDYNPQNTTVIKAQSGYLTTLIFDPDEEVIDAEAGFEAGWRLEPSANRVKVRPSPISQPVEKDGETIEKVFTPTQELWGTNLFIVTSKREYSLLVALNEEAQPAQDTAYVVRYRYPEDIKKRAQDAAQAAKIERDKELAARQRELDAKRDREHQKNAFKMATSPRNWNYHKVVRPGSNSITPDYAYDDGRFMYLGFNPQKTIPTPSAIVNGAEQTVSPSWSSNGQYRVMVITMISPRVILRYGNDAQTGQIVGIENKAYGKVRAHAGDTVSPDVKLELKP